MLSHSHYKAFLFFILLAPLMTGFTSAMEFPEDIGIGVAFFTGKVTYRPGEGIQMTLRVFNNTERDITFNFRSAQRYDFSIEDEVGKVLWRWSEERMFAMVLGTEVLGPEKNDIFYTETYKGYLETGYYKITGTLVAKEKPLSGSLVIKIR